MDHPQTIKTPPEIITWLTSETATDIIIELNSQYGLWGGELSILPELLVTLSKGSLSPGQFGKSIYERMPFLSEEQQGELIEKIKSRLLKPISRPLKDSFGVDIEAVTVYKTKPAEKPVAEIKTEGVPPRTVNLKGAVSHGEQARAMPQPPVSAPLAAPKPQMEDAKQPFHLVEQDPVQEAPMPGQPTQTPQQTQGENFN